MQSRKELDARIREQLRTERERLGLTPDHDTDIAGEIETLIRQAHAQAGQRVVVIIDEYDKPILDNLLNSDLARELREGLKNLYSVLNDADPHLHFVLLTRVSIFSKVSLLSGLKTSTTLPWMRLTRLFAVIPMTIFQNSAVPCLRHRVSNLVGVEFSSVERQIVAFEVEILTS
ncbi:AAA family ATPase [Vreelandella aquamarina]